MGVKDKTKIKEKKVKTEHSKQIVKKPTIAVKKVKGDKPEKKKKKDKDKDKPRKEIVQSPRKLKEPLATICKSKKLTRYETLRKVWNYIRVKKLQDPKNKMVIHCDETLKKLTKSKTIEGREVMSYIKPFMEPLT